MKNHTYFLILIFLFCSLPSFASEVLKKEITFIAIHPMKEVHGICKEVLIDSPKIAVVGIGYKLSSPFQIKIPILKLNSGDEDRDSHIQEILGYPETPDMIAVIESVSPTGDTYLIQGKLRIRGLTQAFHSSAKIEPKAPGQIRVFGKVNIKFSDFKLEKPSILFLKAKDEIEIGYDFLIKI
ncbi:YceI family protein [Leptospira sp. WS92.C1]